MCSWFTVWTYRRYAFCLHVSGQRRSQELTPDQEVKLHFAVRCYQKEKTTGALITLCTDSHTIVKQKGIDISLDHAHQYSVPILASSSLLMTLLRSCTSEPAGMENGTSSTTYLQTHTSTGLQVSPPKHTYIYIASGWRCELESGSNISYSVIRAFWTENTSLR